MGIEINWLVVSLSFAAAILLYQLCLLAVVFVRKKKAEKLVRLHQNRLQLIIDALKQRGKNMREEGK